MSGSRRTNIVKALSELMKTIDGTGTFNSNLYGNSFPILKFWDEINDFPAIYTTAGPEHREYMPGGLKWGNLTVTMRVYVKQEFPQELLELILMDIESLIDLNQNLVYDETVPCGNTIEINIASIITDEGLLDPYGVAEVTLDVKYQVL